MRIKCECPTKMPSNLLKLESSRFGCYVHPDNEIKYVKEISSILKDFEGSVRLAIIESKGNAWYILNGIKDGSIVYVNRKFYYSKDENIPVITGSRNQRRKQSKK